MIFKRLLYTSLSLIILLPSLSCDLVAKENTSLLHIELTGGLGTAEILTEDNISYPVDGGDDSFNFDKDAKLKITIHSKYGIDSIKQNNNILMNKGNKLEKIKKKDFTFNYKTKNADTNLSINLTEMHSRFKITSIKDDEEGNVIASQSKYACVKKSYYQKANEDIEKAIELAQENGTEKDYQILESDEYGTLQSNDFVKGTYIVKKLDDGLDKEPFELIVTRNKDVPYTYIRSNNGCEFSSDETGTVEMIESDQYIQSATRIILKSKNDKLVEDNGTFKIKMLNEKGKTLKNYKKQYLKTDKNGYISMYDGVRWMTTFTLKKGKCVLPVVLPDGSYKMEDVNLDDCSLKKSDWNVSANNMSGLDADGQPVNDVVVKVKGN